jgi:hypothetical protein
MDVRHAPHWPFRIDVDASAWQRQQQSQTLSILDGGAQGGQRQLREVLLQPHVAKAR